MRLIIPRQMQYLHRSLFLHVENYNDIYRVRKHTEKQERHETKGYTAG